jgi:hypothetical protein
LTWSRSKHGDSKLAFALLRRFYGRFGRFPRNRGELHPDAVEFIARAVKADPADLAGYDWSGRTIKRHRHEIRAHFGFRLCGEEDGAKKDTANPYQTSGGALCLGVLLKTRKDL